ncbi:MAG TPA: glycine zipper 2TM domain-containing protein [Albitalea sp.]|jgi:outer membrane lipoprotein SlyB|nr:glycine zipper 2TM domain-containing protein [Albitalea sp.]
MTSKLITLSAVASTLALTLGCSSVPNEPATSVGSAPYSQPSSQYDPAVTYGYVRNITQLETARRGSGAGALLGAVVGGVVGNQIGQGSGRAAATAIGAVGGAVAGNRIEENRHAGQVYYQVDVRLDNGDFRSFDYQDVNGLRVGDRVRVDNGQLQRW